MRPMFQSTLLKLTPPLSWKFLESAVSKSAELTSKNLYIFSERRINPSLISRAYQRQDPLNLFFLCAGHPLTDYPHLDDIDLFLSACEHDEESLEQLQTYHIPWRRTKFHHLDIECEEGGAGEPVFYSYGCVGGTFDDLHTGHKLLLTAASTLSKDRLLVGITHQDLLQKKKLVELLQTYAAREAAVRNFLKTINPTLKVETVAISDPIGPAGTESEMDLLVVSDETKGRLDPINKARTDAGLKPLSSYSVDLVFPESDQPKLSSSTNRQALLGVLRDQPTKPWVRRLRGANSLTPGQGPYVVGLTGGICSGKSTIRKDLEERGVPTIDCDKIGHEVYLPGGPAYKLVVEEFGEGVVAEDGTINRRALGGIVFSDPAAMARLNELVWPCIAKVARERIGEVGEGGPGVVVVEAAVMLEAGWQELVDEVWLMTVSPAEAVRRLVERNGLSEEEARKRLNSQMSNTERCALSDVVICSDWERAVTQGFLDAAWSGLQERMGYYRACTAMSGEKEVTLSDVCRSEKSRSFLTLATTAIQDSLHLLGGEEHTASLLIGMQYLATTLHVQNHSPRALEAMFKMYCEGQGVERSLASATLAHLKNALALQRKPVKCGDASRLFCDVWTYASLFAEDEGDQRILPSIFTTAEVVEGQASSRCEQLLRLSEGRRWVFFTEGFRERWEREASERISKEMERLGKEGEGREDGLLLERVRGSIGYNLQEY